ncbi:MAG: hypothetical protein J5653_00285 [Clostridiales bacterium]|nr:hypothetical protein [Clostridiales bacterium]
MANEIRKCPNCNSPLTLQNGTWFCQICGSSFATDWQADDVERARQETAYQRAQADAQRRQAVYQAQQSIQQAKNANAARRTGQVALMKFAKPFLIIFFVGIILFIGRIILFGAVGFTVKNTNVLNGNDDSSNTAQEQKQVMFPVNDLVKDPSCLDEVIASGYYYADKETAQEIDFDVIAKKTGSPELIELYSIQPKGDYGTFVMMVWKNLYQTDDGTTVELYVTMKIYLKSMNSDGTVVSDYSPYIIGHSYSASDGGYTDLDLLHQETINDAKNSGDKVTELPITQELFSKISN